MATFQEAGERCTSRWASAREAIRCEISIIVIVYNAWGREEYEDVSEGLVRGTL